MQFDKLDLIIVIAVTLCVLILSMYNFGIDFDKSVNIVELLSLLATIFIAIYFGRYLQKKQDIGSRNREVFLRYIDQVENNIIKYKDEACDESFNLVSINSRNKNMNIILGDIPELMKRMGLKDQEGEIDIIIAQLKEIHNLLTYYKEEDILDNIYKIENNSIHPMNPLIFSRNLIGEYLLTGFRPIFSPVWWQ